MVQIALKYLKDYNPLGKQFWCNKRVTKTMVNACLKANKLENRPISEKHYTNPHKHAARIAYLIKHGWEDAIHIDIGIPDMDWLGSSLDDGNHRLAAAFIRKDKFIDADVSGSVSFAKSLFKVDI